MGVYVKGWEMPEGCKDCVFEKLIHINDNGKSVLFNGIYAYCDLLSRAVGVANKDDRAEDCPLLEVEEPHSIV